MILGVDGEVQAGDRKMTQEDWKTIKPLPALVPFCKCVYCKVDKCCYHSARGRRIYGWSTPSWCPLKEGKVK